MAKPLLDRANKKLANLPSGQSRTLALALFVGIPAPGTGAWTGAIIAYLLDMPFGEAMGACQPCKPRATHRPAAAHAAHAHAAHPANAHPAHSADSALPRRQPPSLPASRSPASL